MKSLFKINHKYYVAANNIMDAITLYNVTRQEAPSVYGDIESVEVIADEILI